MDDKVRDIHKRTVKKRIMFNIEDDYYFITYNTILFLYRNHFTSSEKALIDYRKLAYIIPLISDRSLLNVLEFAMQKKDGSQSSMLQNQYYNTRLNYNLFTGIMFALERKGIVQLYKNPQKSCINIWLKVEKVPAPFLSNKLFSIENENISTFNRLVPRIRILTLSTVLSKIFRENGVMLWES